MRMPVVARMTTALTLLAAFIVIPAAVRAEETKLAPLLTADAGSGWEGVGRLNIAETGFCTAALITSEIVLTAAHCLFEQSVGTAIDPAEIEFQAGLRFGRAEAYRGIRRIVLHPDYDPTRVGGLSRVDHDLALLELDRPIRLDHVRPFRTQTRVEAGQRVEVVSYARDRAEAPSRETGCTILARDDDVLVLSCEVDFGASGAPVFAAFGDEMRIVSVISAKAVWNGQEVALAAAMEGELDALIIAFARTPAFAPVGKRIAAGLPHDPRRSVETR